MWIPAVVASYERFKLRLTSQPSAWLMLLLSIIGSYRHTGGGAWGVIRKRESPTPRASALGVTTPRRKGVRPLIN